MWQTLTEPAKTFEEMYAEMCRRAQPAEQPAPPRNVRSKIAGGSAARTTEASAYSPEVHKSVASQARGSGEQLAITPSARPQVAAASQAGGSAEQPATTPSACPHVAALLDDIESETHVHMLLQCLDWLTKHFLWGELQENGPAEDGFHRWQRGRRYTAAEKLEQLITETKAIREQVCADPQHEIVAQANLKGVLKHWKKQYATWMRPETLEAAHSYSQQKWHQCLRKSFRTYLWQLSGYYELTIFFVIAPFNIRNLETFRECWHDAADESGLDDLNESAMKRILDESIRRVRR